MKHHRASRWFLTCAPAGLCWLAGCALQVSDVPQDGVDDVAVTSQELDAKGRPEPPRLGAHRVHEAGPAASSSAMTWHKGAIMKDAFVGPIFWGRKWSDATFVGDKITGLADFYAGYGGSNYAGTCTEYTGSNGTVGTGVTSAAGIVDTSSAPSRSPRVSTIGAEVCRKITSPVANGYYPVYVDAKRGNAQYCAWHSYGTCGGVPVQFGFFFNLDGDPGCDPADTTTGHSQGLAALANVSGHELAETMTDPRNGGWYDSGGSENADKCAWTFNVPSIAFANGTTWKVQGEWSNAAYATSSGYPNLNGEAACLDGH